MRRLLLLLCLLPTLLGAIETSTPTAAPSSAAVVNDSCAPATLPAHFNDARHLSESGKLLAGLPLDPQGPLATLAVRGSVAQHQRAFLDTWNRFNAERADPAMAWYEQELAELPWVDETIYYPFSGPDSLYPMLFFPRARNYLMAGLEPVGMLPDLNQLSETELSQGLGQLRHSLRAILAFSFFRTNDMQAELKRNRLPGVLPIITLFLHQRGYELRSVSTIVLEPNGQTCVVAPEDQAYRDPTRIPGVVVRFSRVGESEVRRMVYFQVDLSNEGLRKSPHYLTWIDALMPRVTYLKAASYLMHNPYFSTIRDFITRESEIVLQDDSGIPLKAFPAETWDWRLYGSYHQPIALFANRAQPDLRAAYQQKDNRVALPFGIGYQHRRDTSNLQRFSRRPPAPAEPSAPAVAPPTATPVTPAASGASPRPGG
jgi:hypothetical protein